MKYALKHYHPNTFTASIDNKIQEMAQDGWVIHTFTFDPQTGCRILFEKVA